MSHCIPRSRYKKCCKLELDSKAAKDANAPQATPQKLTSAMKKAFRAAGDFDSHKCCATCRRWQIGADCDLKLSGCARCGCVYYCSQGCQKADWDEHKLVCKAASKPTSTLASKKG